MYQTITFALRHIGMMARSKSTENGIWMHGLICNKSALTITSHAEPFLIYDISIVSKDKK